MKKKFISKITFTYSDGGDFAFSPKEDTFISITQGVKSTVTGDLITNEPNGQIVLYVLSAPDGIRENINDMVAKKIDKLID